MSAKSADSTNDEQLEMIFDSKNRLVEKHGEVTVDQVYRAVVEQRQREIPQ